jgi:hypothetical protein
MKECGTRRDRNKAMMGNKQERKTIQNRVRHCFSNKRKREGKKGDRESEKEKKKKKKKVRERQMKREGESNTDREIETDRLTGKQTDKQTQRWYIVRIEERCPTRCD